jgi:hypothetical protein
MTSVTLTTTARGVEGRMSRFHDLLRRVDEPLMEASAAAELR